MNGPVENSTKYAAVWTMALLLLVPVNVVFGTAWHEIVGHGLVGWLCGGQIDKIIVTGLQLWPRVEWVGTQGAFGWCHVEGITGPVCAHLWLLAGSLSTLLVSVIAVVLLFARPWSTIPRFALLGLAFWWIDLFTYTLPSLGVRRYILFGGRVAEPYDAALALGIPGWAFQTFVALTCAALGLISLRNLWTFCRVRIHSP